MQTKAAAEERQGIYFGEGLCLPSHAALTSAGAEGLGLGKGRRVRGWRWDQACSSEAGGGEEDAALRMLLGPQEPSGPHPLPAP